jgi:hypothetical protein
MIGATPNGRMSLTVRGPTRNHLKIERPLDLGSSATNGTEPVAVTGWPDVRRSVRRIALPRVHRPVTTGCRVPSSPDVQVAVY